MGSDANCATTVQKELFPARTAYTNRSPPSGQANLTVCAHALKLEANEMMEVEEVVEHADVTRAAGRGAGMTPTTAVGQRYGKKIGSSEQYKSQR